MRVESHIPAILRHVRAQQEAYRAMEADPGRTQPMATLPDPRVDVALLFLAPHVMRPQDVEMMVTLSELLPVLPIIAKVRLGWPLCREVLDYQVYADCVGCGLADHLLTSKLRPEMAIHHV